MPEIYPKLTRAKLQKGARKTALGKGRTPLPGVKTDAKHVQATDKCGYKANRDLAEHDRQGDAREKEQRQERRAFRARLAALSEQGASALEQQGCAFLRLRLRMQRVNLLH